MRQPCRPDARVVPVRRAARRLRTIALTSGKGGVGKTNLCAGLAVAMARAGARVLTVDGDLGKANLDIVMGVLPGRSLVDALSGLCPIEDVLVAGPEGITILPTCSGRYELANLSDAERYGLFSAIDRLEDRFDVLLIDTAAGITGNAVAFAAAAREVVLVATPEPTSIADAYAMTKVLSRRCGVSRVRVLSNMVQSPRQGEQVFRRLAHLTERFLDVGVDYLGFVYRDGAVAAAVESGRPFLLAEPEAPASRCVQAIAGKLSTDDDAPDRGGIGLFWRRLIETDRETEPVRVRQGASR
jgi:flagellar biosynthesis protein FlhG